MDDQKQRYMVERGLPCSSLTYYLYLGNRLVAQLVGETMMYIQQDSLTSTSVVTDDTGLLIDSIKYYPHGATKHTS